MKFRLLPAAALAVALGSTVFIAVRAADAQQSSAPRAAERVRSPRISPEDRAAFFDARLAAARAGLKLTPEQEQLWPAVEQAVRDGFKKMTDLREQTRTAAPPADPIERMRRMADAATTRGETLRKVVDAAQPLYSSLSDDQKRRLPMLLRPVGWMGQSGDRDGGRRWSDRGEDRRGSMGPGGDQRGWGRLGDSSASRP